MIGKIPNGDVDLLLFATLSKSMHESQELRLELAGLQKKEVESYAVSAFGLNSELTESMLIWILMTFKRSTSLLSKTETV